MKTRMLTRGEVLEVLDSVKDPEVPVLSVRELGIVRDVTVDGEAGHVTVEVTPTYSGCPAISVIEADIREALHLAGAATVTVRSILSPAWTTDWITESAKAKLKAYGISPPGPADQGGLVQLLRASAPVQCPYCDSHDTEIRSEFGSTACKSVAWCRSCHQPFEVFKAI